MTGGRELDGRRWWPLRRGTSATGAIWTGKLLRRMKVKVNVHIRRAISCHRTGRPSNVHRKRRKGKKRRERDQRVCSTRPIIWTATGFGRRSTQPCHSILHTWRVVSVSSGLTCLVRNGPDTFGDTFCANRPVRETKHQQTRLILDS